MIDLVMQLIEEGIATDEIRRQIETAGADDPHLIPTMAEAMKVVRDNLREEAALPDDYIYNGVPGFDFLPPDEVQDDRERARRLLPRVDALIPAIPGFAVLMNIPWTARE
jgi:hypothetical protein